MATYYVDPVSGDDANTGTLLSAPCRTMKRAYTQAGTSGDRIRMAESCYHIGGNMLEGLANGDRSWFGSTVTKANLIIDSYDAGYGIDRPVLDGLAHTIPGDESWTHVSGGVWRLVPTGATNAALRLWIGTGGSGKLLTQRSIGTPMARLSNPTPSVIGTYYTTEAGVIAALTSSRMWYSVTNANEFASYPYALYVWTGSETASPSDYYGGVAWVQPGVSADGFYARNAGGNLLVRNLVLRGVGGAFGVGAGNNTTSDLAGAMFENVLCESYGQRAFRSSSGATYRTKSVVFSRCEANARTGATEEPDAADEWYGQIDDCGDTGTNTYWDRVVIHPHIRTHAAMAFGLNGSASIVAINSRWSGGEIVMDADTKDARPMQVTYADGTIVDGLHISGGATKCQIQGKNTTIRSVLHDNLASNGTANDAGEQLSGVWTVEGHLSTYQIENLTIEGCTIDARDWANCPCAIGIYQWDNNVGSDFANEVTFVNNLAVLRSDQSVFGAYVSNSTPTWFASREQIFTTNMATGGGTRTAQLAALRSGYVPYGWYDYEPASSGVTAISDSGITASYRPRAGSPLLGAGTHLGYTRDIERKQRPNPPSIGAFDVATLRTPA